MALAPLYLRGRYVEPLPEYEQAVARVLMAEYLKEQSDRNRELGIHRCVDIVRGRVHGALHAFRLPTMETILAMTDIGCKTALPDGNTLCKVWTFCPEEVEHPHHSCTIVVDNVILPASIVRVKQKE